MELLLFWRGHEGTKVPLLLHTVSRRILGTGVPEITAKERCRDEPLTRTARMSYGRDGGSEL